MKVLHVIPTMSTRYGGPVSVLKALSRSQARAGHQIVICTTNRDYPSGTLPVPTGGPVLDSGVVHWFHPVQFHPLLISLPLKKWIDASIRQFDIIHIHGLYRFPVTYAAWAARKAGIPYVIRPHGSLDPRLYKRSRYNVLLKRLYERLFDLPNLNGASAIHYSNRAEQERAGFLGLAAPAMVVPNGIDWRDYAELPDRGGFRRRIGLSASTPLILFLGRLSFIKGLDLLIPAFALVARAMPTACLVLAGPDNDGLGRTLHRLARKQGVADRVRFVDHLDAGQVRQACVDADVFVMPSYSENFSIATVEAMACGCPVVLSDQVNIWPEVMQASAGKVVALDYQAIADAILEILDNKPMAERMASAGRILARSCYAYDGIVERFDQAFGRLVVAAKQ